MAFDFSGKRVLVTGAGKGIGRALAIALYKSGCHVYAASRTESTLTTLKEECPDITTITLDIGNLAEMEATFEKLDAMDGIVNNAYIYPLGTGLDATKGSFDIMVNSYVWATIKIIQIFSKKMIDSKKKGSIVNLSSVFSKEANEGTFLYCTSKAAIDMISKQFAVELGRYDIRVNSINPTLVMTESAKEYIKNSNPAFPDTFMRRTPRNRVAELEEVVHPIMYLLSDYSSAVTGSSHIVDCGLLSTFRLEQK